MIAGVLGCGAAQRDLVPALMRAYAGADNVVGLDVDKDAYEKFTMRNWTDMILMELWKDQGALLYSLLSYPILLLKTLNKRT